MLYEVITNAVSNNQRVAIASGINTFYINGVSVPSDVNKAEAMLRITANLFDDDDRNNFV